jgi:hypothetical protein
MGSLRQLDPTNCFSRNITLNDIGPTTIGGLVLTDDFATKNLQRWFESKSGVAPNNTLLINGLGQLEFTLPTNVASYYTYETYDRNFSLVGRTLELDIIVHNTTGAGNGAEESYFFVLGKNGGYGFIYESNGTQLIDVYNVGGARIGRYLAGTSDATTKWRWRQDATGGGFGTLYADVFTGGAWVNRLAVTPDWSLAEIYCRLQCGRYSAGGDARKWTVDNLVLVGEVGPPSLPVTVSGRELQKTSGGANAWDAGLFSKFIIATPQSDQSVRNLVKGSGYMEVGWSSQAHAQHSEEGELFWYLNDADNKYWIYEKGIPGRADYGATTGITRADGNEIRSQIVADGGGNLQLKWLWRERSNTSESVIRTSDLTDAQIRALFPIHAKVMIHVLNKKFGFVMMEENGAGANIIDITEETEEAAFVNEDAHRNLLTDNYMVREESLGEGGDDIVALEIPKVINAVGSVYKIPSLKTGTYAKFNLVNVNGPFAAGQSMTFDVRLNGVSVFAGPEEYLLLDDVVTMAETIKDVDTVLGDILELYCMSRVGATLTRPYFRMVI